MKNSVFSTICSVHAGALLAVSLPVSVNAQDENRTLEEITVVAQHREESLLETPIAVTALNSSLLDQLRAHDVNAMSDVVPNMHVTPTIGGSVNAAINIRGVVNADNNLSRDNAVGLYLNGVPIAKSSGAIFDAVDLERIEVLRGPQGTLYGKNTIGGAVNLITKKPTGELGGKISVGLGNQSLLEARGSLDLASIGDTGEGIGKLSTRISGFYRERDGFFDNDGPSSKDFDNKDQWGARVDLALDVTENLRLEYGYDTYAADQNPTMLAITNSDGFASVIPSLYPLVQAATSASRPDSIANDSANTSEVEIEGHSLTISYEMPGTVIGDITLKSITGYRDLYTLSLSDFDGTSLDMFRFVIENDFEQKTQEFQLLGSTERLKYVLGLFYYEDEWSTHNPRWIFQFGGDTFDTSDRGAKDTSKAAYAQFTWTPNVLDDRLDLTLGARWTEEEKKVTALWRDASIYAIDATDPNSGVFIRDNSGNPVLDVDGNLKPNQASDTWNEFTPMAVATYRFTDSINGYAKVSTGFKSGGFFGVATSNASFERGFEPETLTSSELGLKSRLLEDTLQLNMAYFYNDYEDFQATITIPEIISRVVENAGEATMQGVEVELVARPTENLDLMLNYAWLDTEYDEFADGSGNDISNDRVFSFSPENSVFASVRYTIPTTSMGEFSISLDYAWKDDHYIEILDDPTTKVDAYGLLSARAELADIPVGNGSLRVAAWGKNLGDEEYWNNAINLGVMTVNQWADPRSYGIEVGYEF
jgi:iron complex outermembrane receptor protein